MNQLMALDDTIRRAALRGMEEGDASDPASLAHMKGMLLRMTVMRAKGEASDAKLGRWLGYVQGVLVAKGVLSLEECKEINKKWARDGEVQREGGAAGDGETGQQEAG